MALKGLAICTAPRSGSNFLGEVLSSTNALGRPLEYFNPAGRRATEAPDYPDDLHAQIEWIVTKGATPNGVYGVKLFPGVLAQVLKRLDLFAALPNLHFIYLQRRDRLGQAISWARALQTNQYRAGHPVKAEPVYDSRLIMTQLVEIARINAAWDVYFARTGQACLQLIYEDIEANPHAAAAAAAALLGLNEAPQVNLERVTIRMQRDAINEDWRGRFLAEFGGRHWIDLM